MFIKARKRATIGYLNLCIALQKYYRRKLHIQLLEKRMEMSQIDQTIGRYVGCGQEVYVLQVNGQVISNANPITCLKGCTIYSVVVVPGKIINLITK